MRPYSLHSTVTILDRAARVNYRSFRPYILNKIKRVYTIKLMIQYLAGLLLLRYLLEATSFQAPIG